MVFVPQNEKKKKEKIQHLGRGITLVPNALKIHNPKSPPKIISILDLYAATHHVYTLTVAG